MKKSLINNYLAALKTLINDNRITFVISGNFADKCEIVAYFNDKTVLHNFTLFNDSSVINYNDLINHYLAIMLKHPARCGRKQLFSLRYDSIGYCTLAITDAHNLELFGVSRKRISNKFAQSIWNYAIDDDNIANILSCYAGGYNTSYDFNQTILFKM